MASTVANEKGGVGKTTLSTVIALSSGKAILGNDVWSPAEAYLNQHKKIYKSLKRDEAVPNLKGAPVIMDAGGWEDNRTIPIIQQSDVLIVPTSASKIEVDATIAFLNKASKLTDRIILVINKAKKGDADIVKMHLEAKGTDYCKLPMLEISESKLFKQCLFTGQSVEEQRNNSISPKWFNHVFRKPLAQLDALMSLIKQYEQTTQAA